MTDMDGYLVRLRGLKFSLRTLLLAVVAASCGLMGLRKSSADWTAGIVTATLIGILGAVLLAIYGGSVRRPGRVGFALFAGVYFLLFFRYSNRQVFKAWSTTKAVEFLFERFHPICDPPVVASSPRSSRPRMEIAFNALPEDSDSRPMSVGDASGSLVPPDVLAQVIRCGPFLARDSADGPANAALLETNFRQTAHALWCWLLGAAAAAFAQICAASGCSLKAPCSRTHV